MRMAGSGQGSRRGQVRHPTSVGFVLWRAWQLGTRRPGRVFLPAVAIFFVLTPLEVYLDRFREGALAQDVILSVLVIVVTLVGDVFYPGVLERLISDAEYDLKERGIGELLRTMPYWRLVAVNVLVGALVFVGLLALVVPGVVLLTFLALSGPVVNLEHRGVIEGMRRSVSLVRRQVWLVVLLVTVPDILLDGVVSSIQEEARQLPLVADFSVMAVVNALIAAVTGLLLVEIAFRLSEPDHRLPPPDTAPDAAEQPSTPSPAGGAVPATPQQPPSAPQDPPRRPPAAADDGVTPGQG